MVSEVFRQPMRIKCDDDGVTRTVLVKCYRFDGSFAADTFFSVPASTRVRGKYVHGYVCSYDGELLFYAHNAYKKAFKS